MSIHIRTAWSFVRSFVMYSMVLMGAASPGWAGPIEVRRIRDTKEDFSLLALHGPVVGDAAHSLAGGDYWITGNYIYEGGEPYPDNVIVSGEYHHRKAPHNETPTGMSHFWSVVAFTERDTYVERKLYREVPHPSKEHADIYKASLVVNMAHSPSEHDIESYFYWITGYHPEETQKKALDALLTGSEVPGGNVTDAYGMANTLVDLQSGTFDLDIFVYDIDWNQLTGAHIHLGSPGAHGPPIYDLNPSLFEDVGGLGVLGTIQNGHLPMQYLDALLAGHAYIDLHTHQYPNGEVRGQLRPIRRLPGDFNDDGEVNGADYVVWRKGLGTIYTQDDFNIWRANFGATLNSHSGATSSAERNAHAIPEPAAASLLVFGAVLGMWQRRRIARQL